MILRLLENRPMTVVQLVEALELGHPAHLQMNRMEAEYTVQRCGLTPTDLLHRTGLAALWDAAAASEYLSAVSAAVARNQNDLHEEVFAVITERLMFELVKRQLPLEYTGEDLEDSQTAKAIFDTLLRGGNPNLEISARLDKPVIGLGAAAPYFLEEPARRLSAVFLVPQYAGVANAVGAITSHIRVIRRGAISPSPDGAFLLSGVAGGQKYRSFQEAYDALVDTLREEVLKMAKDAGTDETQVEIEYEYKIGAAADGTKVFIERSVTARITGAPAGL
jgi:N-methylhydantoinase A/oxoprolinase/acetone carboxylase beta subunit